jgi:DAACS family dicarboxylate/amino acid:cation (Na+ or H+) symporter
MGDFFRRIKVLTVTGVLDLRRRTPRCRRPSTQPPRTNSGVPKPIAGFVLPLGATMNMSGTALFEGAVVLFLAQVAGIDLSLGSRVAAVVCFGRPRPRSVPRACRAARCRCSRWC